MVRLSWINYREIIVGRGPAQDEAEKWLRLKDFVSAEPQEHEEEIARYLENAPTYCAAGMVVRDVLDPTAGAILFPGTNTDGQFMWPAELAYYVRKYHVRLPPDLIDRMASLGWQPPTKENLDWDAIYAAAHWSVAVPP